MFKKSSFSCSPFLVLCLWCAILAIVSSFVHAEVLGEEAVWASSSGPLVKRDKRATLVSTEYGGISAVRISDNINGLYLLHFFTLEPNSLFLPVVLHADMVFYVHTGSGKLSWTEENDLKSIEVRRGDVYALPQGAVFFLQSHLETTQTERQKLRIYAIFVNSKMGPQGPATRPYSSIRGMVLGFDRKVLQAAFKVSKEVMDELLNGTKPPAIIHAVPKTKKTAREMEAQFIGGFLRSQSYNVLELSKKKKASERSFNLFKEDKDFENCNGWSTTVTKKKLSALKGTNIGLFMVNLTIGSMMGPHWNPMATEVAVVLQGRGMVRAVCSSISNETGCRNTRILVAEGDVFTVPKFHPMAQMAFNNETFVFMGFSTSMKRNHPQFLAGQASVLRTLDKEVLAMSFNVTNTTTMDAFLASQHDSVILGCVSCAEEELRIMEEEIERERKEEREREEEEARKREEERRRGEEKARKREEEQEEEEEEEEERRQQEEEKRKREETERRKRKEEERKRWEEEERQREEEEARQREQEEETRQREEEERKREKKERKRQEEEERQREEEEARQREQEEEERKRQEEEARWREQEQEEEARQKREAKRREEEEQEEQERAAEEERSREEEEEETQREEEQAAREERRTEEAAARQQERERERW